MMDCLMGALAQAVPDRVAADGSGGSTIPSIGGIDRGEPFVFVETMMGAWGGTAPHDGQDGVAHMGANQSNVPIELIETQYPLRVERYGYVRDSGGAGRHRGGLAIEREFRLLADEAVITVRSDKRRFPPYGLFGGGPGSPSLSVLNPGTPGERILPVLTAEPVSLKRGDVFRHVLASGGGYGPAAERDPELVRRDVILGKVSVEQAREVYRSVIIEDKSGVRIDVESTKRLRQLLGAAA
jgi:N-methylhydantoinase B